MLRKGLAAGVVAPLARGRADDGNVTGQHIPLDDLHALMRQHQDLHQGGIRYQPVGCDILTRPAVDSILKLLPGA